MYSRLQDTWIDASLENYGFGKESVVSKSTMNKPLNSEDGSKLIIARNPKTGTSAICHQMELDKFANVINEHRPSGNMENEVVFIRDPVDRLRSGIDFVREKKWIDYLNKYRTFREMMAETTDDKLIEEVLSKDMVFDFQKNWVSARGTVLCYENGLEKELNKLIPDLSVVALNKENTGNSEDEYWEGSADILRELVNRLYKDDINLYKKNCG